MDIITAIDQFLEHLEIEKNRSSKTAANYRRYLMRFVSFAKIKMPEGISQELVRQYRLYLNRLQSQGQDTLKKSTQNYHLIALRSFLKYLAKRDIKSLSPEKVELGRQNQRQIDFLEEDELTRLMDSADGSSEQTARDKAILELLFSTGLRVSELCALNRNSVNLQKGEFAVRGKGGKIRVVFVSDEAKDAVKNYLKIRQDANTPLFTRVFNGKLKVAPGKEQELRLTPRSVQRMIKKYAIKAGIIGKKVSPHVMRHSFATDLLRSGADIRSVQALLGHASVTTTQIYTHVTDQHLREVHRNFHNRRKLDK